MRGFLVSFGIHAVGVAGLVMLPAFSASELPPPVGPSPLPLPPIPAAVRVAIPRPVLPPPRGAGRSSGGKIAPTPERSAPAATPGISDEPLRPTDDVIEPPGWRDDVGEGPPVDSTTGVGPFGTPTLAASPPPLVRTGGDIRPPRKVSGASPVYPPLAKSAGIQGIVILECTIGPDGRVSAVRVLKGQPLLEGAAVAAVEGWSYTPTLLNGVPVSVLMTVTVEFKLNR